MGLLGNFNFDDPETMGLLTAGLNMIGNSGKGVNMNTAQILAGGVGAGMNGAAGVIQARQMMAMQKQKQEHDDLVMQSMKMENMQRQSQMESQQRLQDFQKTFSAQQQDPHAQAMQSMGGNLSPTVANAGTLNQLQGQASAQANDPYEQRMRLAQAYRQGGFQPQAEAEEVSALKFQPKVKEWVDSTVNGQAVKVPYFEDGTYGKPSAIPIAKALHFQDTGGGWSGLDSFTGQKVASGNKTQTLDSQASNALGYARLKQDARFHSDTQANVNKPTWDSSRGQFVSAPSAANPNGSAMSPSGLDAKNVAAPEAYNKAATSTVEMQNSVQNYRNVISELGGTRIRPGTPEAAKLQGAFTSVQMSMKNAFELGALSGPDMGILNNILVDPVSAKGYFIGPKGIDAQLGQADKFLTGKKDAIEKVYGRKVPTGSGASQTGSWGIEKVN